ncbi:hypothetical protein Atai01_69120 [Amycolatopsis taiwanensis]|uniref:Uncharacterized protein n=1 Tax=Amycolatopsis taiwanensis TaxID=342230 RepID=A0A9W6R6R7_9PSEU|nr:hypothetical protein Atai01_69120 [Amycolatopsis taiwanensis]
MRAGPHQTLQGLTTGEISAHFSDIDGASISKDVISLDLLIGPGHQERDCKTNGSVQSSVIKGWLVGGSFDEQDSLA